MARDRLGSDYSENLSDATTCSCMTSSVDKCSLRSCSMLQEPFFLHPPGSRPRDGIYINPMSAFIGESQKPKDTESFYLHSPHDLVYTRITHLFSDSEQSRNGERVERKDETLTEPLYPVIQPKRIASTWFYHKNKMGVLTSGDAFGLNNPVLKVDVHINNRNYKSIGNGTILRADPIKDNEHAYEQICLHRDETDSVTSSHKNHSDNVSDSSKSSKSSMSKSSKTDRRYSRSSSNSDSSNINSEIHGYSSPISTPSLSRNSSNEHINKSPKVPEPPVLERKHSNTLQGESEKDVKIVVNTGPILVKPPPPPPPPPLDIEEIIVVNTKIVESNNNNSSNNNNNLREDKKDVYEGSLDTKSESGSLSSAANKSDVSCEQPEVAPASPPAEPEETKPSSQVSHLVNRHMVLPFIPPQFANAADSNTLLKPSEYLKSICKSTGKNSLSKARSVDNLDIQSRVREEEEEEGEGESKEDGSKDTPPGPPPPPLPPLQKHREYQGSISVEPETPRTPQPLATISIQDLTSVQLRRTNSKMHATKTFSAPPPRSVSMTNVSEPFFVQKTDLIAELKKTKDIPGIKKLKVERAQVEKTQEQHLMTEMSKAFSAQNFVDQIPEKDSSGNVIPIWKRQMLARKAAERAKKELEEQIARENEERRQKAIPAWKRQLLAKKDNEEKKNTPTPPSNPTGNPAIQPVKIELTPSLKRDASPVPVGKNKDEKTENENKRNGTKDDDPDDIQIIPWRAQLRKTNSKLNIID